MLLKVSLQTLHELEEKKDVARELAKTIPELPHWPIGKWDEQVGTWPQQTGTWDDVKRNHKMQLEIKALSKSGTDIRDRGGYIDALRSHLNGFVTSDKQFVATGPSKRINERYFTKVLTPEQLADELGVWQITPENCGSLAYMPQIPTSFLDLFPALETSKLMFDIEI